MNLQSIDLRQASLDVKVLRLDLQIPPETLHLDAHPHIIKDHLIHIHHTLLLQITKFQVHNPNLSKELQLHFLFSRSLLPNLLKNVVHL
jgi:hypothetical protein